MSIAILLLFHMKKKSFKFTRQYNAYFEYTMLPQLRHIIVNVFSCIPIEIVNTSKTNLKVKQRSFLSKDHRK